MTKRDPPGGPSDARSIAAAEHFPGQNPHPVMRISNDGVLTYGNAASAAILRTMGLAVGDRLPPEWLTRIGDAVGNGRPVELAVGDQTYELLAVANAALGFTNVYGTDVTAARLVDKFPDLNPNPVLRISERGELRYANHASAELRHALGVELGGVLPADVRDDLFAVLDGQRTEPVEVSDRHGTYALVPVQIPELGLINVYGTDVTAAKALVKFPDQNPNPVFRITWEGVLVYANPTSHDLIEGVGASVGRPFPAEVSTQLLDATRAGGRRVEIVSGRRTYALFPVDLPEFGFINVYGTDVTAVRELEAANRENERLLLNVLPEPIADRLRRGEQLIADRFEDVTLLFADIVEFTRLSDGMGAEELVTVLNELFTVFDRLVDSAGLEKVKTIGDAYMVVGGLPIRSTDHTDRVATMALALAKEVGSIGSAQRLGVQFRVGIHCGPVVAGIIGSRKFSYDVWGDTVNVASRMESTGLPGRIQVTGAIEQRLRGRFHLEPRGLVEIKGKGPMPTWFLAGSA
jgi:class 3 adenylate cyclase